MERYANVGDHPLPDMYFEQIGVELLAEASQECMQIGTSFWSIVGLSVDAFNCYVGVQVLGNELGINNWYSRMTEYLQSRSIVLEGAGVGGLTSAVLGSSQQNSIRELQNAIEHKAECQSYFDDLARNGCTNN
ncbi:hypothetical protein C7S18_19920 [Ahniella affigens]|uniref:Uncharacterized protein n=2 Tax=Ahniella affigens TaxID=2021234 RepID=A0A2P1PWR9_9GAMM|nr:hypothetical protein C7S18_19920 [Ahniella affigens]